MKCEPKIATLKRKIKPNSMNHSAHSDNGSGYPLAILATQTRTSNQTSKGFGIPTHTFRAFITSLLMLTVLGIGLGLCSSPLTAAEIDRATAVKILIGEAANQGQKGMQAVGEVLRRRGTVRAFSASHRKDLERFLKQQPNKVLIQAQAAWEKSKRSNITKGATHYENIKAFGKPTWAKKMTPTVRIKDHQFYKEVRS